MSFALTSNKKSANNFLYSHKYETPKCIEDLLAAHRTQKLYNLNSVTNFIYMQTSELSKSGVKVKRQWTENINTILC